MLADLQERRGIKHLRIHGKGGELRFLPLHPVAAERIYIYLEASGHNQQDIKAPLFLPLRGRNERRGQRRWPLCGSGPLRQGCRNRGGGTGRARAARYGSNQCPGARGGYRQGPSLAGPCQYQHDADLRSPAEPARGFTHVQGEVLKLRQSEVAP